MISRALTIRRLHLAVAVAAVCAVGWHRDDWYFAEYGDLAWQ